MERALAKLRSLVVERTLRRRGRLAEVQIGEAITDGGGDFGYRGVWSRGGTHMLSNSYIALRNFSCKSQTLRIWASAFTIFLSSGGRVHARETQSSQPKGNVRCRDRGVHRSDVGYKRTRWRGSLFRAAPASASKKPIVSRPEGGSPGRGGHVLNRISVGGEVAIVRMLWA